MSFFELLRLCNDILVDIIGSVPDVLSVFTSSLGESIVDSMEFFYDFPLIGDIIEDFATNFFAPLNDVTLLNFMFGVLIPVTIVYSFVKWLVGVITGS